MDTKQFIDKYYIDRSNGNSVKWSMYQNDLLLPMWIADMDFKCDEKVIDALKDFINEGDFGYYNPPHDYFETFINWHQKRHNITYQKDWICFSKGAVNAIFQIIHAFTNEKDKIMINTPLYPPFKDAIEKTNREVIISELINDNGYFYHNFEDIENKFKNENVKMLLLCSPHNPIGRVWKEDELNRLFELCQKYNVLVCSDEVHSDIIMPNHTFLPSLAFKQYQDMIISITTASKTFSLAIYSHTHIIIPNETLRDQFMRFQNKYNLDHPNIMNALPTYYCYKYGEQWLDDVINVINENYLYLKDHLGKYLEMSVLEGTYLVFLNLGEYNYLDNASELMMKECGLRFNDGLSFGKGYQNWVRINLATSKDNVIKACDNIVKYIKNGHQ